MVGTLVRPRRLAASTRPCPAMMRLSASTRTGLLKPNLPIEAAIWVICLSEWVARSRHRVSAPPILIADLQIQGRQLRDLAVFVASSSTTSFAIRRSCGPFGGSAADPAYRTFLGISLTVGRVITLEASTRMWLYGTDGVSSSSVRLPISELGLLIDTYNLPHQASAAATAGVRCIPVFIGACRLRSASAERMKSQRLVTGEEPNPLPGRDRSTNPESGSCRSKAPVRGSAEARRPRSAISATSRHQLRAPAVLVCRSTTRCVRSTHGTWDMSLACTCGRSSLPGAVVEVVLPCRWSPSTSPSRKALARTRSGRWARVSPARARRMQSASSIPRFTGPRQHKPGTGQCP